MTRKLAIALAAGAVVGAGVLTPTDASAWCRCRPYYSGYYYGYYAWAPAWRPAYATYRAPVLVRRKVTTYAYAWSTRPYRVAYAAPVYRPVVYAAWRPRVRVVAFGW